MTTGPCAALLQRVGGDRQVFAELCEAFLQDAPARLAAIRDALAAGDARALRSAAHAFKGAAAVFDAAAVVMAARQLEEVAEAGDLASAPALCMRLEAHGRKLIDAVREGTDTTPCRS